MITQLKTKNKIVYNALRQLEDYVYLTVNQISFDGANYTANVTYSTSNDIGVISRNIFDTVVITFTTEEADQIFTALQCKGDTFTEQFVDLIVKASQYQVGQTGVLGLEAKDWELCQ